MRFKSNFYECKCVGTNFIRSLLSGCIRRTRDVEQTVAVRFLDELYASVAAGANVSTCFHNACKSIGDLQRSALRKPLVVLVLSI